MYVPKYIQQAIRKNAEANVAANKTDSLIRNWLLKNNINNDEILDSLIDNCVHGNNPEEFIKTLESK